MDIMRCDACFSPEVEVTYRQTQIGSDRGGPIMKVEAVRVKCLVCIEIAGSAEGFKGPARGVT